MSENDSSRYRRGLSRRPGTMSLQSALRMIRSRWTTFLAISLFMLASEIALKAFLVSESSEVQVSGEGRSFFANQAFHKRTEGQYAYVTFLCDDELLPSTRVLLHSLQKVGSQYPVLVLALSQVSREARWELQMLGGQVVGIGKLQCETQSILTGDHRDILADKIAFLSSVHGSSREGHQPPMSI